MNFPRKNKNRKNPILATDSRDNSEVIGSKEITLLENEVIPAWKIAPGWVKKEIERWCEKKDTVDDVAALQVVSLWRAADDKLKWFARIQEISGGFQLIQVSR